MPFMPFQIMGVWLRGLFSVALLAAAVFLFDRWYENRNHEIPELSEVTDADHGLAQPAADRPNDGAHEVQARQMRRVGWQFGFNQETAYLLGALLLLFGSLGGGLSVRLWKVVRARRPVVDPPLDPTPAAVRQVQRPDGTVLHVELYGPPDAPPIVLTHGWGLDSTAWCYVKRSLASRFRLIVWDLPGLGRSGRPHNNDWSVEKLAGDLEAVLALAGDRPAVLVGHSIGGMITLTFCRLFPEALATRVCGLVLVHTTYTNPVRTASLASVYTVLQKPVLEPLCWLMIWLAPFVWLLNWVSYLNGSLHQSTDRSSFSGRETGGQLEFITRLGARAWPAVVARGFLGMFRYDATDTLSAISVPTLVVAGDDDRLCSPEASRYLSEAIPGGRLRTLESARHCGHFEHYEPFATELTGFAAACQPSVRREMVVQ